MPLCDACQERAARIFTTTCTGGESRSTKLCQECYEQTTPREMVEYLAAMQAAKCRYCGGQPCGGGMDFLSQATGEKSEGFMCVSCSQEHSQHIVRLMGDVIPGAWEEDTKARLREVAALAEAHMQEYTARMKASKCRYCGGQPCTGGMDYVFQMNAGTKPEGFMCVGCAKKFERFVRKMARKFKESDSPKDWMNRMPEIALEVDAQMRQRARRGTRKDGGK